MLKATNRNRNPYMYFRIIVGNFIDGQHKNALFRVKHLQKKCQNESKNIKFEFKLNFLLSNSINVLSFVAARIGTRISFSRQFPATSSHFRERFHLFSLIF